MTEFYATVSFTGGTLIPEQDTEGRTKVEIENSTTNSRNLEVIRLFDNGNFRVSSINEIQKLAKDRSITFSYRVEFNTGDNLDIQQVIERFKAVFVFKAISEVTKN